MPDRSAIATKVSELVRASLAWAFSPDRLYDEGDLTLVYEALAQVCVEARHFVPLDETYECFGRAGIEGIFLAKLEPYCDQIKSASLAKDMLIRGHDLEAIICNIDPAILDVDQALRSAEQHHLWDAMLHIYTQALHDFCAPIRRWEAPAHILFGYLKSVLTGSGKGKEDLYRLLLDEGYLSLLLSRDSTMLDVLDAAFEDAYLDEAPYSRQAIVNMLLPLRQTHSTMFCARNLAKFPQFIRLSPSTCHQLLEDLADGDKLLEERQLAAEYLLSVYTPAEPIEHVLEAGRFWRILLQLYERRGDYQQVVRILLLDVNQETFDALEMLLKKTNVVGFEDALPDLLRVDVARTARIARYIGYTGKDLADRDRLVFYDASDTLDLDSRHDHVRLLQELDPARLMPYLQTTQLDTRRLIDDLDGYPKLWALDRADDPDLFAHAARLILDEPATAAHVVEMAMRKDGWSDIVHPLVRTGQSHLVGPLISKLDVPRLLELSGADVVQDLLHVFGQETETSAACARVLGRDLHGFEDGRIMMGLAGWRQTVE